MTINMFNQLPHELIRLIMSYDDRFKYRNGQWMTQIPKNDKRYSLLQNIERDIIHESDNSCIYVGENCFITIFWGYRTNEMYNNVEYYYGFNNQKCGIYTLQ